MLATVGVAAMVAFVFLDPLMRYVGRGNKVENPVVVETKYGPIKDSELANIRQSRELVEAFLRQVSVEMVDAQIRGGTLDARLRDRFVGQWFGMWQQQLMSRSKMGPEAAAVETLVLNKRAEKLGMVVSDRAINDLLKQITNDSLTKDTLQEVVNHLQTGRRVSVARLFEALRVELTASKFSQMFLQSVQDVPPAQRFEYYARLNRQAKAEIMPLAVADFAGQVDDPGKDVLQAFFQSHKNRFPDPASPDPGFKEPRRAAFQYFKANFAKAQDEFKPQVTDEEIAEYYEKNKAQFRVLDLPGETTDEPQEGEAKKDEADKDEANKDDTKNDETKEDKAAPESEKPATDPQPPKPDDAKPESSPQAARGPCAPMRLVAAGADEKAAEPPADKSDAKKPEAKDETADTADKPAEPSAEKPAENPDEKPGEKAEEKPDEPAAEAPPEPKYEPLEKVKETIRDQVAGYKAGKQIGDIIEQLSADMRRYADDMDAYDARKSTDPKATPPKPFPFAELAKAKGIEAKELPLVTAAEAAEEDIGKVYRENRSSQFGPRIETFDQFAFSESLPTYRPTALLDPERNAYLFWKTEEQAAYVPTLEQAKDKVVRAWKLIEARTRARDRAEEYAAQARDAKKPLREVFEGQESLKVTDTGPFSWMTLGDVPSDPYNSQPRMSQVEGVEYPGKEFMESVFSLDTGGVGVTTNHPQNTVYVVQLTEFNPSIDDLRKDFAAEHQMRYMAVAAADQQRIYLAWLSDLEKDAKVHWLRQADTGKRHRGESAEPPPDDGDF